MDSAGAGRARVLRRARAGVQLSSNVAVSATLPLSVRENANLTRMLREAVSNVLHHSRSTTLRVSILGDPSELRLTVEDEGEAKPVESWPAGRGCAIIRDRARTLCGQVSARDRAADPRRCPSYNVFRTTSGIRYADFEDVTLGPPEWDRAGFGAQAAASYDVAAARAGVRALDRDVLRVMDTARMLQVVACLTLVPQLPMRSRRCSRRGGRCRSPTGSGERAAPRWFRSWRRLG